jgi:hypothetical protein
MPTDARAWSVLIDTDLAKVFHHATGELCDLPPECFKKCRRLVGSLDTTPTEIISEDEGLDAPVAEIAVKFAWLQRQSAEGGSESLLFCLTNQFGLVMKALRQGCGRSVQLRKQIPLLRNGQPLMSADNSLL